MICVSFEKQNPDESYANKYQEQVDYSYSCKLMRAEEKINKPF